MTGAELRIVRTKLGLSISEMLDELELMPGSKRKYRRWENGQESIPREIADRALVLMGREIVLGRQPRPQ